MVWPLVLALIAASRLEGTVRDTRAQPVAGVRVALSGPAAAERMTDERGRFVLDPAPPGRYRVQVTPPPAWKPLETTADVRADAGDLEVEITLEAAPPPPVLPGLAALLAEADRTFAAGQPAEAAALYRRALAQRPEDATAVRRKLGLALLKAKQPAEALSQLDDVLRALPDDVTVRGLAVEAALLAGLTARGLELLDALPPGRLERAAGALELAGHLVNADRADRALPYLDRALALDPTLESAWYRRGLVHLRLGNVAQARGGGQEFARAPGRIGRRFASLRGGFGAGVA